MPELQSFASAQLSQPYYHVDAWNEGQIERRIAH